MGEKMKLDGYEVKSRAIADVIDKLLEADGSFINKVAYLADAARLLAFAVEEAVSEKEEA